MKPRALVAKCSLCDTQLASHKIVWGICDSCMEQAGLELAYSPDKGKVGIKEYVDAKILARRIE